MGQFVSLCKKCKGLLTWFLTCEGGRVCDKCGTHNTEEEVINSFYDEETYKNKK